MHVSKRIGRSAVLVAIAAWLTMRPLTDALGAPSGEKLVLTGTVTAILQVNALPASRRNWRVTVQVERVKAGRYSEPTFTFTIHSPARSGLEVGRRYTIEATWTGQEYLVDEARPMKHKSTGL